MNQQPDKFFREKLEGYQKAAPASAWEKIAAAQAKKNNNGLWLKIAASILFLIVAAYLLWTKIGVDTKEPTTLTKVEEKNTPAVEQRTKPRVDKGMEQPEPAEIVVEKQKFSLIERTKKKTLKQTNITTVETPDVAEQHVTHDDHDGDERYEQEEVVSPIAESSEVTVASQSSTVINEQPKNITLVFTVKEADEYLDKKALAQATSDKEKPSTLKKLLKKANDLGSQDPFGELRQKKNEILALNFKNEKRGQNK